MTKTAARRQQKVVGKVLIADDDVPFAKALGGLFEKTGFRVETAHGVDRTIESLLTDSFDVIILDMRMPERGGGTPQQDAGIVVGRLMRRLALTGHDTIVVLFTAYPSVRDCFAAIEAGAYYVPKTLSRQNVSAGLVNECQRLVKEKHDRRKAKRSWVDQYYDELKERFGGKTVAVLGSHSSAGLTIKGAVLIGDRKVFTARTSRELRKMIACDPSLRRADPVLLSIS